MEHTYSPEALASLREAEASDHSRFMKQVGKALNEVEGSFRVAGTPAPQGSKSVSRSGHLYEQSKKVKPWRKAVSTAAKKHRGKKLPIPKHLGVVIAIEFIMPRTKAMRPNSSLLMTQRPDADKLERSTLDALSGVIFEDDSQIIGCFKLKRRALEGEIPGCKIHYTAIRELDKER